ncbi:hypothetical protein [Phormidium sp. CCY1219]|uniref:hypothetical protein n=1 Tax=Phormidium sp. CCY1219 TaxID=2886104 RepID=UPI002D1EBA6D|nr:hypothetical protein [Phormidium sp. CCY1219]MEB3827771.1 hypothetical protein [Phormidium sp. CCY1219]
MLEKEGFQHQKNSGTDGESEANLHRRASVAANLLILSSLNTIGKQTLECDVLN